MASLVLPIVLPSGSGRKSVVNWYVARVGAGQLADVSPACLEVVAQQALPEQFDRVRGAYDVEHLMRCRMFVVGTGAAREAIQDLARIGVGKWVIVDPEIVDAANLSTQDVYADEIGRPKVFAVADAIHRINPAASVVAVRDRVQDIPRRMLDVLLRGSWADAGKPQRTVIGAWSDSVPADAYATRVALNYGLPIVQAALHKGGVSGEVLLAYPGRTAGCIRCATPARYRHYLNGGANDATSRGVPLWTTLRLNALKMAVVAAALSAVDPGEQGTAERMAQTALLEAISERPVAIMRLAALAAEVSGVSIHARVLGTSSEPGAWLFDETIWRQNPPRPGCPDCGGTGDLLGVAGTLDDLDAIPEVFDAVPEV